MSLSAVGKFSRDGPFSSDIGIANLPLTKGTHWVDNINQNYLDSYGFSRPQKISTFIIKRIGYCLYSDYKIQSLTNKRDSSCAA